MKRREVHQHFLRRLSQLFEKCLQPSALIRKRLFSPSAEVREGRMGFGPELLQTPSALQPLLLLHVAGTGSLPTEALGLPRQPVTAGRAAVVRAEGTPRLFLGDFL